MEMSKDFFEGRTLLIATKHGKESVIAPILEKELGVICVVAENLDTDLLGTFTGEIERENDALITAQKKCEFAMELTGYDLVLASEGSFGAHPSLYFVAADDELLLLRDQKNDLEIAVREISCDTNFTGKAVATENELLAFAKTALFPTHALILRKSEGDKSAIKKAIQDEKLLLQHFHDLMEQFGEAYVETDMRAMYNPSRMEVIKQATLKLVDKIKSICPQCETPGFSITDSQKGLPCELCRAPTRSTLNYIYCCTKCNFEKVQKFPHGKMVEDATFCDHCNP